MSPSALPGSTLVTQVADPVNGGHAVLRSTLIRTGLTVNVPTNFGISVYADVNGNPVEYFDGKTYHSLQADYVASPDGTVMYYIEPPSTYDQSSFNLTGDYDLYTYPGDEWRYYLVSGMSSNMTNDASFEDAGPFLVSRRLHRLQHRAGATCKERNESSLRLRSRTGRRAVSQSQHQR